MQPSVSKGHVKRANSICCMTCLQEANVTQLLLKKSKAVNKCFIARFFSTSPSVCAIFAANLYELVFFGLSFSQFCM